MCYRAEFGRSALKDVVTNTGEPQKFRSAEITPPGMAEPRYTLPTFYHVKFGSSATKDMHMNPQNWGGLRLRPLWEGRD